MKKKVVKKDESCPRKDATLIFLDKESRKNFKNIIKTNISITEIDIDDFVNNIEINFCSSRVSVSSRKYDIDAIRKSKIIYYPYSYEATYFNPLKGDSSYNFGRRQFAALIEFIEGEFLKDMNVVNPPEKGRIWSKKLYQLQAFCQFLPQYTIPSKLKTDYNNIGHGSIIKHISENRIIDRRNVSLSLQINKDLITDLKSGTALPFISQDYIDARQEFRHYVFGDSGLTLTFSRESLAEGIVDIHGDSEVISNATIVDLSEKHLNFITAVKSVVNLSLFAIDFFCLPNNEIKILEINPLSSWNWLPKNVSKQIEELFITSLNLN